LFEVAAEEFRRLVQSAAAGEKEQSTGAVERLLLLRKASVLRTKRGVDREVMSPGSSPGQPIN
jgi:hypothetical protein